MKSSRIEPVGPGSFVSVPLSHSSRALSTPMEQISFHVTEDGEAMGTLRQFATRFQSTPASILECLRHHPSDGVVLDAGDGRDRLLILGPEGVEAICSCASPASSPC